MEKIIGLFKRDYEGTRLVYDEVVPGAEWVLSGEGVATQKLDGTCCLIRDGKLYKRFEVARGKTPPAHFEAASEVDPVTGKQQGWVPVGDGPEDRWHREAFTQCVVPGDLPDGTYELVGPEIQGNPERFAIHLLYAHGAIVLDGVPRDFAGLKAYFASHDLEGIVWHHPDGRMVKLKGKDLGVKRGAAEAIPRGDPRYR